MKKTFLTIAIILGIALGASAQNGGLFGKGPSRDMDYEYGTREGEGPMINLPGSHGTTNDESAPLGGGIALLTGLGTAYLVAKKRKNAQRGAMMALLALLCAFAQGAHAQNYNVWDGHSEQQPTIYTGGYWVLIDNAANLAYVRNHWNDIASGENPYYKMGLYLRADLDMSAASWIPLGFNDHKYEGTFDGNGHTIKIRIEGGDDNGRALFDEIDEYATVKNLHVDGYINVGDAEYVAGIVSDNNGLIENCWVSANITSNHYNVVNEADLGGIAGHNLGLIRYCCMTGNVTNTARNSGVGGLVGRNNGRNYIRTPGQSLHAGIYHCTFYGSVSVDHAQDSKYVGQNNGSSNNLYDAFNQTEYDSASGNDMYRRAIKYPYSVTVNTVGPGSIRTEAAGEYDVPGTYPDATFTLHVTSGQVARVTITDADGNDIPLQGQAHDGSSYWFVMRNKNITATIVFYENWPTQGTGTEEDPYRISSADDWNKFAHNVTYGRSYSGSYVKLTDDISVTTMAGGYQDDDNYQPFSGTFDGDGHTLTLNVNNQSRFAAPFKCVSGATIKNLRTAGTIDGTGNADGKLLAGIIGVSFGNTTITGCRSSVTLTTDFGEDAALAGLVAGTKGGSLTIAGCVFDGSMTGASNTRCAGIAGYEYTATTTTISDCLFIPATLTISTADDFYTKTISRDADATITGCYYTQPLGAAQGTAGYFGNINVPNTLGDLVTDYGVVKAYANGLFFNGKYYYSDAGSLSDPYIIDSEDVLARIAPIVNSGVSDFVYKHFILTCDLDLSGRNWTPIGTTDRPFRGNFNGNNHTISNLTVNNPSGDYNGLFGWVEGYIDGPNVWVFGCDYIKNFVVKNANVRGRDYTGGVAGRVHGQLVFENVILDGATVQGASFTSGFIGSAEGDYDAIGTLEGYSELHVHNCLFVNGSVTENTSHDDYDFVDYERNSYVIFGNIERHSVFYNNYFSNVTYNGAAAPEDHYNVQAYPVNPPSNASYDFHDTPFVLYDNKYYIPSTTAHVNLYYPDLSHVITSVSVNGVQVGTSSGNYDITIDGSQATTYTITVELSATDIKGSGNSEDDPICITDADAWNLFAKTVNNGYDYRGKFIKLTADISVSTMVGMSQNTPFCGTFLGDCVHTLTFKLGSPESAFSEQYCAPFRYVIDANFRDLKVAGDIYTSNQFAGGLVAWCYSATIIRDCQVGTVIHSSVNGDGSHGGFVAQPGGDMPNIQGCVYNGRMLTTNGTTNCGGFIGWTYYSVEIVNSIYAPSGSIAEGETPINSGDTFARYRGIFTSSNLYHTEILGYNRGNLVYTFTTAPANLIELVADYGMVKAYKNGIVCDGTYYVALQGSISLTVQGYGNSTESDHWAFIASPVAGSIDATTVGNIFSATEYDLYRFNPSVNLEWENWKKEGSDHHHFNLENGRGYLYATKETKTLGFSGTFNTDDEKTIESLPAGFDLVGNPFTTDAYINKPYYTLNDDGSAIVAQPNGTTTPIAPCHGVIVEVNGNETVTFSKTALAATANQGLLNITVAEQKSGTRGASTGSATAIDNAIVRFGEGEQLGKFHFGNPSANICIPQGGKEYAVANVNVGTDVARNVSTNEMPVNFKASKNGEYTISVNPENVEFDYLHLIDNLTGADVDLLQTPSYTFTARNDDYESRFRLVFVANNADLGGEGNDDFAFISNGQLIITSEGTLQIIDMMGRVIVTKQLSTTNSQLPTANFKAGVYVLRLVNGDNIKTQKIVIK